MCVCAVYLFGQLELRLGEPCASRAHDRYDVNIILALKTLSPLLARQHYPTNFIPSEHSTSSIIKYRIGAYQESIRSHPSAEVGLLFIIRHAYIEERIDLGTSKRICYGVFDEHHYLIRIRELVGRCDYRFH